MMVRDSSGAFDRLYLRHASAVHRLRMAILASPEAAEEVVQETFLQLWRRGATYSPERASMRTWLLTIARPGRST
jgi:RNA polymerase sigma-70 factor, ECF subfamily